MTSSSDSTVRDNCAPAKKRRTKRKPNPSPDALLWGWPEVLAKLNIPQRTISRMISEGAFPKPVRRVGKRPFWRPADICRWAEGGDA